MQETVQTLEAALPDSDVVYMTRVQKSRFASEEDYEKVSGSVRWTINTSLGYRLITVKIWRKMTFTSIVK